MAWTIKGEAGKTMDATARSLDSLNVSAATLRFQSLSGDAFTWTAETTDATGAGTIIPDAGQVVELWKDAARKFKGHVTGIKAGSRQITITAEGPWWWMERTNLTSDVADGSGTTATRPVYVFATGSLQTSLQNLLDRAITNGVPMTRGTVAASYSIPQATLAEQPCSEALATLIAWAPDSVAWFDYSGTTPVMNIGRRGGFSTTTYTIGTDAVETGELVPRLDLEVTRNELHYVTRNATTGKPEWALQASGTGTAGKVQMVAVSGPEIVDFLPRDDFDTVSVQSQLWSSVDLAGRDAAIKSAVEQYGGFKYGASAFFNTYLDTYTGSQNQKLLTRQTFHPLTCKATTGAAIPATPYLVISTAALPEWAVILLGAVQVNITGYWIVTEPSDANGWSALFAAMKSGAGASGGPVWLSGDPSVSSKYYWMARQINVTGYVIPTEYAGATSIYKPWEYSYLTPPAGLAANLVAAQNWVPWEGPVTLVQDDCSGDNLLGYKYRLANGLTPCATMDALAKGVTHDLMRGRTTIDLGAPARLDFGTLVSRIRREPKDNIVYV